MCYIFFFVGKVCFLSPNVELQKAFCVSDDSAQVAIVVCLTVPTEKKTPKKTPKKNPPDSLIL